jgi:ABC-type phosphate transport system substrate-binding protein
MPRFYALLSVLSLVWVALTAVALAQQPSGGQTAYRVIVHPSNPANVLERRFLEDVFLKKVSRWPHDKAIRPADLPPSSPVRGRFTFDVLARSVAAVRAYWHQRIFSGRGVPPPELPSDERVIDYVLRNEGAVGYVSASAATLNAKVVAVER